MCRVQSTESESESTTKPACSVLIQRETWNVQRILFSAPPPSPPPDSCHPLQALGFAAIDLKPDAYPPLTHASLPTWLAPVESQGTEPAPCSKFLALLPVDYVPSLRPRPQAQSLHHHLDPIPSPFTVRFCFLSSFPLNTDSTATYKPFPILSASISPRRIALPYLLHKNPLLYYTTVSYTCADITPLDRDIGPRSIHLLRRPTYSLSTSTSISQSSTTITYRLVARVVSPPVDLVFTLRPYKTPPV